ncbi:MAG TPA: UDP-N-acetylmuramyl-tripeptide synthetase, partial [Methylomirabilota bacterium]|nr:UDP-N-acetylmuramyl-tripeptide synthetase [Methylomirabilota bacterium]
MKAQANGTGEKSLGSLLRGVDYVDEGAPAQVEICKIAYHSDRAQRGTLFFALAGAKVDGNRYVADAIARGAAAIASAEPRPAGTPAQVAWVQVREPRKALALAAANFFGHPAKTLRLAAITGTNGKTTTAYLVDSILKAQGAHGGLFGTVEYRTPRGVYPSPNTTPESLDLQGFFAEIRDAGGTYAVLEASSHALCMDRLWGCQFGAAVFTNLTREHMDYHKTFEDYFAAKRRLFEGTGAGAPECAVLNVDDPYGKRLVGLAGHTLTYAIQEDADITAKKFDLSFSGLSFTAHTPAGRVPIESRLVGRINVYNIL